MRARYERIVGSSYIDTYMREQRRFCRRCKKVQSHGWTYDDGRNIVCSAGCGQIMYELRESKPPTPPKAKPARVVTDRDLAIKRNIAAAERNLDRAIADVVAAAGRAKAWRARIGRLESALAMPADVRSARAKKGLATRAAKAAAGRAITVRREEP